MTVVREHWRRHQRRPRTWACRKCQAEGQCIVQSQHRGWNPADSTVVDGVMASESDGSRTQSLHHGGVLGFELYLLNSCPTWVPFKTHNTPVPSKTDVVFSPNNTINEPNHVQLMAICCNRPMILSKTTPTCSLTIVLRNDDVQEFDSKWDGTLFSMT